MKTLLAGIAALALFSSAVQPAAAQNRRSDEDRALTLDQLAAAHAGAEAQLIAGVAAIVLAIGGLGGAFATGLASERHGTVCTSGGGGWLSLDFGWGGCTMHDVIVGHDAGLLAASITMAAVGLLTLIIGAVSTHVARHRLARLNQELVARGTIALGASPDGAIAQWRITF